MNLEPSRICQKGAMQLGVQKTAPSAKPWLGAASMMESSTSARRSGHHFKAQRASIGPWLKLTRSTLRPDRAAMVRMADTTNSVESWISARARSGS
jgi:hypothetical protein